MKNWFKATGIVLGTLLSTLAILGVMGAVIWFFSVWWVVGSVILLSLFLCIWLQKEQLDEKEQPAEGGRRKE